MPNRSEVTIEEITDKNDPNKSSIARYQHLGSHPKVADLALGIQVLQTGTRMLCAKVFRLTWKGDRTPVGAKIEGYEILWAQHGRIIAQGEDGQNHDIGQYDRKREFAGESREEHEIIVHFQPPQE